MRARSSITIRYIAPPVPGPVFYPAGVWAAIKTYERTSSACPFVLYDTGNPTTDLYYYLAKVIKVNGSASNVNPKADYAANGVNAKWKPLENIGYVFANLIMANFGLIAGAVFSNNKLFSQFGKIGNADSTDYQKLKTNPDGTVNPTGFVPNVLIDWLRGYASILKGDIGPFKIDKYELTNSDYNAGISMKSSDGSYVKIGNSVISFFDTAKLAVNDLTGRNTGVFVNVKKESDSSAIFRDYNNALQVIGQSSLSGRNYTEHTNIHGSSNTPQLLASVMISYMPSYGVSVNNNFYWWDVEIYSFVRPVTSVKRLSEGVYQFGHNLFRRPTSGKAVNPREHVTQIFIKAYPIAGGGSGGLFAAQTATTDTTFTIRTADDSSPNDVVTLMVEVYNITHMQEFARIANTGSSS